MVVYAIKRIFSPLLETLPRFGTVQVISPVGSTGGFDLGSNPDVEIFSARL